MVHLRRGCHYQIMSLEALTITVSVACLVTVGLLIRQRRARITAAMLVICALAVPLARVSETSSALLFRASLVLASLVPVCAAAAGLSWPIRPLARLEAISVVAAIGSACLVAGVAPAALLDVRSAGCNRCPGALLPIGSGPEMAIFLTIAGSALTVGWGLLLAALAVRRWAAAPLLARRHDWPMLLGGAAVALVAATESARSMTRPADLFDPTVDLAWYAELVLLFAMTAGIWLRMTLPRRLGVRAARAVLAATPTSATLVHSLARAVGDPDLSVTYQRLSGERIDIDGRPVAAPEGQAVLGLTRSGQVYAEMWYCTELRDTADLVHAAAATSGVALEHAAAQARLRADALDAAEARRRLVVMADAERRRLERDLHDGAQQGLVTLSLRLTAAGRADPGADTRVLKAAQDAVTAALHDLRAIARGLFPVSLAEAGLLAALRDLGDHAPIPLLVDGAFAGRCSAEADSALYHLILDVVRGLAPGLGGSVRVVLSGGGPDLATMTITTRPVDPLQARRAVLRAEDRLAALSGTLTVTATADALTLKGAVPCGS